MTISISAAVQTAIVARLTSHFAAAGKSWPVYDEPPNAAAMPFVQIGHLSAQTDDTFNEEFSTVVVSIIGWTVYAGQKQAHEINAEVRAALNDCALPLATGTAYRCTVDRQYTDRDDSTDLVAYIGTTILTLNIQH